MRSYISCILLIILLALLIGCSHKAHDPEAMKASADKLDQKLITYQKNQDVNGTATRIYFITGSELKGEKK